jgi:Fe-S-cluster containining protein
LNFHEWLKIVKNYGIEATDSNLNKLFIKRKSDGSCAFLHSIYSMHLCGLQQTKPKACKLWPFKIVSKPLYGYTVDASYDYGENRLFVYVDSACSGLKYGSPTWEFNNLVVKEFVEIALGSRTAQYKTTGNLGFLRL